MIAVATIDSLSIIEPSVLKKTPSSVSSSSPLESEPSTTCWSTDNSTLYLASSSKISRFQPSTSDSLPAQIYSLKDGELADEGELGSMVCKDASTLIFSVSETIHILESCSTKPKLSSTRYTSHKSSVTSLSLSTDNTFLLSTSSNGAHFHNLTLNSTTALRGIPGPVMAGAFHSHIRTRLLIGSGSQLLVYDTARPSGPTKTFALEGMGEGDVQMIACSPFSKTLVAVGLGGAGAGTVGLVDLEKEKGLFRTVNTKVPITTLSFSPEGALIYAGTVTGKILVLDLRSLDKPPAAVEITGGTGRVVGISVQKKASGSTTTTPSTRKSSTVTSTTSTTTSPTSRRTVSVSKPGTPATKRTVSTSARSATSTAVKPGSSTITKKPTDTVTRKVFSPIRSPLANSSSGNRKNGDTDSPSKEEFSVKLETLGTLRRSPGASTISRKDKEKEKKPAAPRTRTTSTISRASVASRTTTTTRASPRSTNSTSTLKPTESISTAAASRSSRFRTKSGDPSSSVPPVPPLPKGIVGRTIGDVARPSREGKEKETTGGGGGRERTRTRTRTVTKTPSPDLPSLGDVDPTDGHHDPLPPLPTTPTTKKGKGVEFRALGLGTPGAKRTTNMEDRQGKNVEFCEVDEEDVESRTGSGSGSGSGRGAGSRRSGTDDEDGENDEVEEDEEAEELSMQISPARRPGTTRLPSFSETVNANIFNNFDASPSRPSHGHGHGHGQGPHQSPQNLLRNIVHSVLVGFPSTDATRDD
ncbi:hypothetical protein AAF712_005825 [Marasmius tenuissimus]|uniref:Uncharacterized protein n=1 Tax=Marasmius tenuissimus TaxID=585030 RepID=A0ABR2ZZ66_9AGAR